MAGVGMMFGLIGSVVSAMGAAQQAEAQAHAMEAEAAAAEKRARQENAIASRDAERKMEETRNLQSKQRAMFASSGGGIGGPGIANTATTVITETGSKGRQQSNELVWEGRQKADDLDYTAQIKRYSAGQARQAGSIGAASAILGGFSKIAGSFNIPSGGSSFGGSYYYG